MFADPFEDSDGQLVVYCGVDPGSWTVANGRFTYNVTVHDATTGRETPAATGPHGTIVPAAKWRCERCGAETDRDGPCETDDGWLISMAAMQAMHLCGDGSIGKGNRIAPP